MNAAIAQHLNVAESAIVRVEEWANVLFAVVRDLGARFVSKKVTAMQIPVPMVNRYGHNVWEIGGARVEQVGGGFTPTYKANGAYVMVSGHEYASLPTVEAALQVAIAAKTAHDATQTPAAMPAEQKNRAFQASAGMMTTSTGLVVIADEWDEIEGDM